LGSISPACFLNELQFAMTTDIKKYTFKAGLPHEIEILDIGQHYDESKEILTTIHRSGFYQVLWFQGETSTHLVDFKPVEIKPDTLLFLDKDVINSFDNKRKCECKAIIFTDDFFCKTPDDTRFLKSTVLFNDLFSVSKIQLNPEQVGLFAGILQSMATELLNTKDSFQSDVLKNLLHNFLLLSERERRKQDFVEIKKSADLDFLMLFKDLLETNFKARKPVKYYAQEMLITEKRLNQATTMVLDKTPKEIIDERLGLEAKRMLAHSTDSVKEIGYSLGFDEPTNFIKYFKKHYQRTPHVFREQTSAT
jgi:AraC family transcriptional activator of pobA